MPVSGSYGHPKSIQSRFRSYGFLILACSLEDQCVLGLMTKFWEPGLVKTRLGQSVGMDTAAALHQLFVSFLCERLSAVAQRRELCVAPQNAIPVIQDHLFKWNQSRNWSLSDQGEGDLGHRMERWFVKTLQKTGCSILIGGDCPTLSADDVRQAVTALNHCDLVLGPAVDGGYYLIGLAGQWRPEYSQLFRSMPWSTDRVYTMTQERANRHAITIAALAPREDVDTIEELSNLRDTIRGSDEYRELRLEIEKVLDCESLKEESGK